MIPVGFQALPGCAGCTAASGWALTKTGGNNRQEGIDILFMSAFHLCLCLVALWAADCLLARLRDDFLSSGSDLIRLAGGACEKDSKD